jgi:hypothetical protein
VWADYNVLMYKRYRGTMRVPRPWRRYLMGWPRLLPWLAAIRREEDLYEEIDNLGWQSGLLLGSFKHRTTPVP